MKTVNGACDYMVTEEGEVFSVKRGYKKLMRFSETREGYLRVKLVFDDGTKRSKLVHRLVAEAFIKEIEGKPCVNHKDGDKKNNKVSNLEWVTYSENAKHAYALGLKDSSGENNSRNILTQQQVLAIYAKMLDGERMCDVAKQYNVSVPTIADIKFKRNWHSLLKNLPELKAKPKSSNLSEATVRWVCLKLQEGLTARAIMDLSHSKTLSESAIWKIRSRQTYTEYSKDYNW